MIISTGNLFLQHLSHLHKIIFCVFLVKTGLINLVYLGQVGVRKNSRAVVIVMVMVELFQEGIRSDCLLHANVKG